MGSDNISGGGNNNNLLIVAIVVVILSAVAFFVVLGLNKNILLAPETGTAQVDIIKNVRLTMSLSDINFGAGFIANPAGTTLDTQTAVHITPAGSWLQSDGVTDVLFQQMGFIVENDGNVDVDMNLRVLTEVSCPSGCWLTPGLSATNALLNYKVRNCGDAPTMGTEDCRTDPLGVATVTPVDVTVDDDTITPAETCTPGTTSDFLASGSFDTFIAMPFIGGANPDDWICDKFRFTPDEDEIRIDLELFLPEDITPTDGIPTVNTLELTVAEDLTADTDD